MRRDTLFAMVLVLIATTSVLQSQEAADRVACPAWQPQKIRLVAEKDHPWWSFPVRACFTHRETGDEITLSSFWDGNRDWMVRFAPTRVGTWTYRTSSADAGLDGRTGQLLVHAPTEAEIAANPNYRGHLQISANGRFFEYSDGTPLLLLADTLWAGNTARCGLGEKQDGPFFQYLADRRAKGFTAVLMQYFHGYGDYPDSPGHRNEGGKPFLGQPAERLNPAHFQALDVRMRALWDRGFVAAIPTTWWGKTKRASFTIQDARRTSAYCAVRYGAYNALWSLSGEYQYTFRDCGWTPEQINSLGDVVQRHNPYRHPLSIHPSGRTDWPAPHNCQSSRPFHRSGWLDHHWLQTGQSADRMHNIVGRSEENRALEPVRPVFCSESFYEHTHDSERVYHARWQAWVALLNGCAGYGYGAQGMWQFYDPNDPQGETGKTGRSVVPWRTALRFEGSSKIAHVATLLRRYPWWRLEPCASALLLDGEPCPVPTANDITPPHCAIIPERLCLVYVPRDNQERQIQLTALSGACERAEWFDPRNGKVRPVHRIPDIKQGTLTLPERSDPATEDWVWVMELRASSK